MTGIGVSGFESGLETVKLNFETVSLAKRNHY